MKLIDKDVLIWNMKGRRYSKSSMGLIEAQPEVEAIPIKWIKEYAIRGSKYFLYPEETEATIKLMLEDWREENEKNS